MKYRPPFVVGGNPDPNAPYVDEDTPGAILGSIPPAKAIEDPQREIGYVIDKVLGNGTFGNAQDPDDTTQLYQAIIAAAPLITQDLTINITPLGSPTPVDPFAGDPFDKLSSAFAWLRLRRIMGNATVDIAIAAGTYSESVTELDLSHPDGLSITITAVAMLGAFPLRSNLGGVRATDEATLRSRFAVKIECAGDGIVVGRAGLSLMINICFIGSGIAGGIYFGTTEQFTTGVFGGNGPASGSIENCAFIGFNSGGLVRSGGSASLFNVIFCHNAGIGLLINDGGYTLGSNVMCVYNGAEGAFVRDDGKLEISGTGNFDSNGTTGVYVVHASAYLIGSSAGSITITGNTGRNVLATLGSFGDLANCDLNTAGGGAISAQATNGSRIYLTSPTNVGTLSPAGGVEGNSFSSVTVL